MLAAEYDGDPAAVIHELPTCCATSSRVNSPPIPERAHERQRAVAAARRAAIASAHGCTHPCRADLDREEDRALAALRSPRRGEDPRSPPQHLKLQTRQHFRLRALGVERLRHRHLAYGHRARGRAWRTFPDAAFRAPRRRDPLRVDSWPKVERVLQAIDAIETLGIDPADAAPECWRHLHNRLAAGHEPRPDTRDQHAAWLKRRSVTL